MNRPIVASSWGRGMVLALVLVVGALGFCCGFDGDNHHGQGSSPDLCLTVLSVSFASALLAGPLLEGWAADSPIAPVRSAWATVPVPPPRSL